jgi:glycosyltransferase involved in cell wall biosynthesis
MAVGRISVVIPFYNNIDKLVPTLESVHAQRLAPAEVILVDDGSAPAARDRLRAVQRRFGFALIEQPNQGPAVARNTGIRAARHDFVALLDADDLWHPDKLLRQQEAADAAGDAALVVCNSKTVDASGRFLYENRFARFAGDPEALSSAVLNNRIYSITSALFFRREAALQAGLMNPALRYREDHAFLIHLIAQGAVAFVDAALSSRVVHREGYSHAETSPHILEKDLWDERFFQDVAHRFGPRALAEARALARQHTARNDIILGRRGTAIRSMLRLALSTRQVVRPGLIVGAALAAMVRPGLLDARDPALAARRKAAR